MFFYLMTLMNALYSSSVTEKKRLIGKGMSNIYLKVTIEKNWGSQNL